MWEGFETSSARESLVQALVSAGFIHQEFLVREEAHKSLVKISFLYPGELYTETRFLSAAEVFLCWYRNVWVMGVNTHNN